MTTASGPPGGFTVRANDGSADVLSFDASTPNMARVYNYWLDGKDHYQADRDEAERLMQINPDLPVLARQNREFLTVAVQELATDGVRQFIDLGSGLPTSNNTHEAVHAVRRDGRVVYVDYDPVVVTHAVALLAISPDVVAVRGDLRDPAAILSDEKTRRAIDLDEPVAVLLGMVLHFSPADVAAKIVAGYAGAIAPGSYVVVSVGSGDQQLADEYRPSDLYNHPAEAIAGWLDGLEVLDPGVADAQKWLLEPRITPQQAGRGRILTAVARKPRHEAVKPHAAAAAVNAAASAMMPQRVPGVSWPLDPPAVRCDLPADPGTLVQDAECAAGCA